jgi:hypothetical protein
MFLGAPKKMKRIRCVSLLTTSEVQPSRIAEILLRRECMAALVALLGDGDEKAQERWSKQSVPKILNAADKILRDAIDRSLPVTGLRPVEIRESVAWTADSNALAGRVLEVVSRQCIERVYAEAVERIARRRTLPLAELSLALVPFTDSYTPEKLLARECWCGCWVEDGVSKCSFCGGPAPGGRPTRVWRRVAYGSVQLDVLNETRHNLEERMEKLREMGAQVPSGVDPEDYLRQLEWDAPEGEETHERD